MTYEELKALQREKNSELTRLYNELYDIEEAYIKEHLPFTFKKYQIIKVTAEVTEESRKLLTDEYKAKPRYQLRHRYTLKGMVVGFIIGKKGELRPCFWGGKPTYSLYDKIISIESCDKQNSEKCTDCHFYRDGGCWITGNTKPDKQVDENSFVCGYYHERRRI